MRVLNGIPDAADTVSAWEQFSGRRAQNMDWHLVFAGYRFAMIMEHALRLGIPGRFDSAMAGDSNLAIQLIP